MKKEKGFSMFGTLMLLMFATVMLHVMIASQISAMQYRKKKFQSIQKKVLEFNRNIQLLREKNERK